MRSISGHIIHSAVMLACVLFNTSCDKQSLDPCGEDWSFVVFADIQQGYGVYGRLAEIIGEISPSPALAVCCGDLMLRGGNEIEWQSFWNTSEPVTDRMPLYIARGNHDGNDPVSEAIFMEQTGLKSNIFYFAFEKNNSRFIILDTEIKNEENGIFREQLQWLKDELAEAQEDPGVGHIFLFMHRPLFPQGKYADSPLTNSTELHQMFVSFSKIKAVFAGHEHFFNFHPKDGIPYLITGGGGGNLYSGYGGDYHHFTKVSFFGNENRINIKTIGIFYEVVEDFDL
ncbi:MAG: hypothetical protein FJY07_04100 [Bacteroidetes bacterium]|nr:hypothetical protein [Bacteroidota bacterium]